MEDDNNPRKRKAPGWLSSYTTTGLADLCADSDANEIDEVEFESESSCWSDSSTDESSEDDSGDDNLGLDVSDAEAEGPDAMDDAMDGAGDRPRPGRTSAPGIRDNPVIWNSIPAYRPEGRQEDFIHTKSRNEERFPLRMKAEIGVPDDLFGAPTPTELQCFEALFDPDIIDQLITDINDYARRKKQQNTPTQRYSTYNNWTDVTEKELLKFLAVTTVIGMDKKPSLRDYWSSGKDFPAFHTPWFNSMFDRRRFEVSKTNLANSKSI